MQTNNTKAKVFPLEFWKIKILKVNNDNILS